jgi:hypothetical protein
MGFITHTVEFSDETAEKIKRALVWPIPEESIEVSFELEYKIYGEYIPATYFEPEEHPEVEFTRITVTEVNGFCIPSKQQDKLNYLKELLCTDELEYKAFEDAENVELDYE